MARPEGVVEFQQQESPRPARRQTKPPAVRKLLSGQQKKVLSAWLPLEMHDAFKDLVVERMYKHDRNITPQSMVHEALNDLFAKYDKPRFD